MFTSLRCGQRADPRHVPSVTILSGDSQNRESSVQVRHMILIDGIGIALVSLSLLLSLSLSLSLFLSLRMWFNLS